MRFLLFGSSLKKTFRYFLFDGLEYKDERRGIVREWKEITIKRISVHLT